MKEIPPIATDVVVAWSVRLSVCMSSVTLMHQAKVVGWNETPFGYMWSQVTLHQMIRHLPQSPNGRADFGVEAMSLIAKLLWPLFCLSSIFRFII